MSGNICYNGLVDMIAKLFQEEFNIVIRAEIEILTFNRMVYWKAKF